MALHVNKPRDQYGAELVPGCQGLTEPPVADPAARPAECPVCLQHYTRQKRVPRVLHCDHTFCTPCLENLTRRGLRVDLLTVRCPLCRWTSCLGPSSVDVQDCLLVNTQLWDCILISGEEENQIAKEDTSAGSTEPTEQPKRIGRISQAVLNISAITRKLGFRRPQRNVTAQPLPLIRPFWEYFIDRRSKAMTQRGRAR